MQTQPSAALAAVPVPSKKLEKVLLHFRMHKAGKPTTHEGRTVLLRRDSAMPGMFCFTEARCGKHDVFCRKIGRKIVEGRMVSEKHGGEYLHESDMLYMLNHWNKRYRERYNEEFFRRLLSRLA